MLAPSDASPLDAARRLRDQRSAASMRASLPCFWEAADAAPSGPLFYEIATVAYSVGDEPALVRSLRAAVRVAPQYGDAYFELGNVHHAAGQYIEAVVRASPDRTPPCPASCNRRARSPAPRTGRLLRRAARARTQRPANGA